MLTYLLLFRKIKFNQNSSDFQFRKIENNNLKLLQF